MGLGRGQPCNCALAHLKARKEARGLGAVVKVAPVQQSAVVVMRAVKQHRIKAARALHELVALLESVAHLSLAAMLNQGQKTEALAHRKQCAVSLLGTRTASNAWSR